MTRKTALLTVASVVAAASAAFATVSFDPTSGTGFVGKGDVQTAFGWNNAKLQQNAGGVSFSFNDVATYLATCTWQTGNPDRPQSLKTHNVDIPRHTRVNSSLQYDARTHKQIDGFLLNGYGQTSTEGTVPVVGGACVGNEEGIDHNGQWSAVELVGSSGGTLTVNYGGSSVQLWP